MPSRLDFEAIGGSVTCCLSRLFALRALSRCKHDMGTLSCLNMEQLERLPTPLFGRLVRCSTNGRSFARLHRVSPVSFIDNGCKLFRLEIKIYDTVCFTYSCSYFTSRNVKLNSFNG